jgi:hypothetical protein
MHNRVDGPPTNPSFVSLPPHVGTKFCKWAQLCREINGSKISMQFKFCCLVLGFLNSVMKACYSLLKVLRIHKGVLCTYFMYHFKAQPFKDVWNLTNIVSKSLYSWHSSWLHIKSNSILHHRHLSLKSQGVEA